jgi:hypothetical protein
MTDNQKMPEDGLVHDRHKQTEAAGDALLPLLNELMAQGHEDQDLSNALFGYAMSIMVRHHGKHGVARHLYMMALKFADPHQDPLNGPQIRH